MTVSHYCLLLLTGTISLLCLWKVGFFGPSNFISKTSIQVDLSLPKTSIVLSPGPFNRTSKKHKKHHNSASRYMLQLYHRRPDSDIVRALQPLHMSQSLRDGGRLIEYLIPSSRPGETLEAAELLATAGMILKVSSINDKNETTVQKYRRDDNWRAFDLTKAVQSCTSDVVRLIVKGRIQYMRHKDAPVLLLSYSKPKRRKARSIVDDDPDDKGISWDDDNSRRRRRNSCRKRPLYVDFALISYDQWIVAPPGYEAYQCIGKCFYPLGDHLSPTKHAIVQTLVHGALQGADGYTGKGVGRACCVPTRLAPTSLLYLDASGTLTYQYGYEDMVVTECGCR